MGTLLPSRPICASPSVIPTCCSHPHTLPSILTVLKKMLITRLKRTYAAALWDALKSYIGCMIGGFLDVTASEKKRSLHRHPRFQQAHYFRLLLLWLPEIMQQCGAGYSKSLKVSCFRRMLRRIKVHIYRAVGPPLDRIGPTI